MTTITSAKNILAHSVFLLSAVLGGWTASAILSAPITAVEHAMMRGCEDDVCGTPTVHFHDENGDIIASYSTNAEACIDGGEDSDMKCSMDGQKCTEKECCPWWKFWC